MKRRSSIGLTTIVVFWTIWMALSGVSTANLTIQKKAKEAGFPATNCQYCHNEKLPKKGTMSHNDRGKWLLEEKTKREAKEVDPAWLKDYPGDKK